MVNVLVVSDIRIYREGLRELLSRSDEMCVLGVAASDEETFSFLAGSCVDVMLLDIATDKAISITKSVSVTFSDAKIVAFGLTDDKNEIIEYAEAGISGYVSKDSSAEELVKVILQASQGELDCSAKVAGALLERLSKLARTNKNPYMLDTLTPRELQVAQLISKGLSNSEIASHLKIRVATAKTHVHHVLDKLGVSRRAQVVMQLDSIYGSRQIDMMVTE
jgi:DNA-binding NarL/FixJ family response regulator